MSTQKIDAYLLRKMFLAGAKNLESKKEWINELNVFPVPDGDTGTNMTLTILSAAKDVGAIENLNMELLAKAISSGSLKGARGNSGVILSQLLRGFSRVVKDQEALDAEIIAEAFEKAVETAYKAVMKPKEGTILTVASAARDRALELLDEGVDDLAAFFEEIIKEADDCLSRTPDMLPVLKEAGVVDSGGQGLVEILRGAFDAFLGKEIDYSFSAGPEGGSLTKITKETEEEIRFGYCTEYIIVLNRPLKDNEEREYKNFLQSIGDSIVVVADDDIVKTHVHTNDPGVALTRALTLGSLSRIKIDNMREEHQEKLFKDAEKLAAAQAAESMKEAPKEEKNIGFLAVASGEGLKAIFLDLGADEVLSGGQTMNPSAGDILEAAKKVPAKNVFLLPNNKNIILAAEQAVKLSEDKKLIVLPTTTIPQGITALVNFVAEMSPEENEKRILQEIALVKTAQVTYAVRDTELYGIKIKEGDYMGLDDKQILYSGPDREETAFQAVSALMDEESGVISLYFGEDVTEEEASALADRLEESFPEVEVEVSEGGQSVYYYIISIE